MFPSSSTRPRPPPSPAAYRNGVIDQLEVTPPARANDVVLMTDVPVELSGSATVTGYDAWRMVRFAGDDLTDPALWAATADPDGDGLANFSRIRPRPRSHHRIVGQSDHPATRQATGIFKYTRTKDSGLTYKVYYSTTLSGWTLDASATQTPAPAVPGS